jgi:hypothetical protein
LQSPFEHFKEKGYPIVPPSPRNEFSTRHEIELKMKQGLHHLEGIFLTEKRAFFWWKKDRRREMI